MGHMSLTSIAEKATTVATPESSSKPDPLATTSTGVSASTSTAAPGPSPLLITPISVKLVKMKVNLGDRVQVTQEMLDCIPTSKYSEHTRELIDAIPVTPVNPPETRPGNETVGYADSDNTIIYWSKDDNNKVEKSGDAENTGNLRLLNQKSD